MQMGLVKGFIYAYGECYSISAKTYKAAAGLTIHCGICVEDLLWQQPASFQTTIRKKSWANRKVEQITTQRI